MKKTINRKQKAAKVPTPIVQEDLAGTARRLTATLWDHLPPHRQCPYLPHEERPLAILGARNCFRRINFDYPDDVLNEKSFAKVVRDLLEAMGGVNMREEDVSSMLQDYQGRGFIIPRYRVLYCARMLQCPKGSNRSCREECQDREDIILGVDRKCVYGGELLKEICFGSEEKNAPPVPGPISPVRYYRKKGRLIEDTRAVQPGSKEFRFSKSLFTFSQAWQVFELYGVLHRVPISLLTPPKEYVKIRESQLPFIKETLEEIGHPKFCKNPKCMRPLSPSDIDTDRLLKSLEQGEFPLVGKWPRKYCSLKCSESARNSNKPISTPRVKRYYTKGLEPFRVLPGPILSVE